MGRSSREKVNKKMLTLNNILDQMNTIVIYKTFHPKVAKYSFQVHMEYYQDRSHASTQNLSQ